MLSSLRKGLTSPDTLQVRFLWSLHTLNQLTFCVRLCVWQDTLYVMAALAQTCGDALMPNNHVVVRARGPLYCFENIANVCICDHQIALLVMNHLLNNVERLDQIEDKLRSVRGTRDAARDAARAQVSSR